MTTSLRKNLIFILRWINASLITYIFVTLLFFILYAAIHAVIYNTPIEGINFDNLKFIILFMLGVLSIFGGFLHTKLVPSILKRAYILSYTRKNYPKNVVIGLSNHLKKMVTRRTIMAVIFIFGIGTDSLLGRCIYLFLAIEFGINAFLLSKIPKSGPIEILDKYIETI